MYHVLILVNVILCAPREQAIVEVHVKSHVIMVPKLLVQSLKESNLRLAAT